MSWAAFLLVISALDGHDRLQVHRQKKFDSSSEWKSDL